MEKQKSIYAKNVHLGVEMARARADRDFLVEA